MGFMNKMKSILNNMNEQQTIDVIKKLKLLFQQEKEISLTLTNKPLITSLLFENKFILPLVNKSLLINAGDSLVHDEYWFALNKVVKRNSKNYIRLGSKSIHMQRNLLN